MGSTRHRIPFSSSLKDRAAFQLLHNRAAGLDSGGGRATNTAVSDADANAYDLSLRLQVCCTPNHMLHGVLEYVYREHLEFATDTL